jgi:YidC/Oxa1 family membrane protein insertase
MFDAIARVLAFFYELPVVGGSYGFAIILLTGAVMTLLMPLTLKATRSTIKMQEVQPKLKELQRKHKDDKQALNTELMALYQEHGINPVGGCLPMLAQLPVFLVLFQVLRGLSRRVVETPFFEVANHARVEAGGDLIGGQSFDPKYLSHTSDMYLDLSTDDRMAFGPFDLAAEALDVIRDNILHGVPYVLLILFVVVTSFYQQRQISARRTGTTPINPQQEMIMKFMPLLTGVWSFVFPAGLVVYWATSNVFRIGQQAYITRTYYNHKAEDEAAAVGVTSGDGGGGDGGHGAASDNGQSVDGSGPSGGGKGGNGGKSVKGGKASGRSEAKPARSASAANGAAGDDRNEPAPVGGRSRDEAWARRRRERARAREATKNRSGESSRVTPKGTRPSGSKKKRKR